MQIGKDLFIKRYNEKNESDFRKLKLPREFDILSIQRFSFARNIFIIRKKGFFGNVNSLGYAIICDLRNLSCEKKEMLAKVSRVNEEIFNSHVGPYIEDFMIARRYRREGLATAFFMELKKIFPNEDFLLSADGDGLKFWDKVGFSYVDKSRHTMILNASEN